METTKKNIEILLNDFSTLSSWEDRYKKIIVMGKKLSKLETEFKNDKFLIKGCQSQVWLKAELSFDKKLVLKGESDSIIVQGLLSLLIFVYSNKKPQEILNTSPDFLEELGLKKHLTPSRANGVYAMVTQILYYAKAFQLLEKKM